MDRVAIVADSSACLPGELVAKHRIRLVALGLNIDGQIRPDGSLTAEELFRLAESSRARVQTASPPPGDFLSAFRTEREAGAGAVLCLTLSAAYSGTYSAALAGAELAKGEVPVIVVDTGGLAMTHGFAVLGAARALEGGATVDEAAALAARIGRSGKLVGTLDTLRYLVKGGRVPWMVGWAASILHITPVLSFENGSARSIARPRTWAAAKARMLSQALAVPRPIRVAVMHSAAPERAAELADAVCEALQPLELLVTEFSSVMAVHTGPGFVGLAVCRDE
ncbi:MAG TPA: DegV family protein [Dehalococcoidia bacterium]|jgi:DegV family protein with EDD domain|nr:DegV family protein [Dehalococcoidia bacterium]